MAPRVKLEDIAAASDTSVATVSLALRQKPGVSRATRDRILRVAGELGYESLPRASAEPQTRTIAVILRSSADDPERTYPLLNQFFSIVISGVQQAASLHQLNLVLGQVAVNAHFHTVALPADHVLDGAGDGVLLLGYPPEDALDHLRERASRTGTPLVVVDAPEQVAGFDSVSTCNRAGARIGTQHLIEHGHREIVFANVTGRFDRNFNERYAGYVEAMSDAGLPPREVMVTVDARCEFDEIDFTAVMARNDIAAFSIAQLANNRGLEVPDDVSIVGFDNIEMARMTSPGLTTLAVDHLAMGRMGVELLINRRRMPSAPPMHVAIESVLIERGSVAPPPQQTGR